LCSNDWSNETSVVSTNNGVKSHDTNPGENKFYRLKAGVTPESKVLSTYKASLPKSTALMNYKRRKL
jgi:peptidyl-tRNA hydrolase